MIKKKLKLKDLKVQSFVTEEGQKELMGGITGNCGSFINITCPDPKCDFKSIPVDECITEIIYVCSNNCTDIDRGCDLGVER